MKEIYLVLTYTGTILSKIIKVYTKKEYAHVSIALDRNLEKMYSFGRLNPYIAFIGGFVHEGIDKGTFKRFKNTKAIIFRIAITEEQYQKLERLIGHFEKFKKRYRFNIIGLMSVALNIKLVRRNCFYCAEFVQYALKRAKIENSLPRVIKPLDFLNIEGMSIVYKGLLREYKSKDNQIFIDNNYYISK